MAFKIFINQNSAKGIKFLLANPMYIVTAVMIIGFMLSFKYSYRLDRLIPFGRFLWILFLVLFMFFMGKTTNKSSRQKNQEMVDELNRQGDESLFNFATRTGKLKIFDLGKGLMFCILVPFFTLIAILGISTLQLAIFEGAKQLYPFGLMAIILSYGVSLFFFFQDKRILNAAKRRNEFVDIAEKRWKLSKIVYISMVLFSLIVFAVLITNNVNLAKFGVITNGRSVIYDGRR